MATGIWGGKVSHSTRRKQKVLRATPKWLTLEHRRQMHDLYCHAKYLNRTWRNQQRGRPQYRNHYDVDHIVPLEGNKVVCGLHVPWNLQIIERSVNSRKGDKFEQGETPDGVIIIVVPARCGQLRVIDNLPDAIEFARDST